MKTTKAQRLAWYKLGLKEVERRGRSSYTCVSVFEADASFRKTLRSLHKKWENVFENSHILLPELHKLRTTPLDEAAWFFNYEERVDALKYVILDLEGEKEKRTWWDDVKDAIIKALKQ